MALTTLRESGPRAQLEALARNYRWTWSPRAQHVFERLRAAAPCEVQHPLGLIAETVEPALSADPSLASEIADVYEELATELADAPAATEVAYFSPEFAFSETLPQYSGGLGVLAGDHLKAASDARLPLAGVGLLYREGFFHQSLDASGGQTERYEFLDPAAAALTDTGLRVQVELGRVHARVAIWRADVGRVPLYLLDTALPGNSRPTRAITDRLYGGDSQHRLRQELILGVGGVRALQALGVHPRLYHLNEGHAGFLALEMLNTALADGADLEYAIESVRGRVVFTTHTPVPAGMDRFPDDLLHAYLVAWEHRHHVPPARLLELGRMPGDPPGVFNMASFCMRLAGRANGVSKLHGGVSRELFAGVPGAEAIGHVTNGVHARTWVSPELQEVFDRQLGPAWAAGDQAAWDRVPTVRDIDMRSARRAARRRLIDHIECAAPGMPPLDPEALTVGFARRFATYKRASLLFVHRERLARLLADDHHPIQFIFAGKAHPADEGGKALIREITGASGESWSRGRVVFLPDYDMGLGRLLVAGCDVWLNNPLRPLEASGTSGMKAALNGVLNCSVRDGWWDELYDGHNGWAIPTSDLDDPEERNLAEAAHLLDVLEWEILPLYYRDGTRPSAEWFGRGPRGVAKSRTRGNRGAHGRRLRAHDVRPGDRIEVSPASTLEVVPGDPRTPGARWGGEGTNFAAYSEVAEAVDLCIFDERGAETRLRLPGNDGFWHHGYVPVLGPGTRYGFRVHGPWDPLAGHRCNPAKLLLDPYGLAVDGEVGWSPAVYGHRADNPAHPSHLDSAPCVPRSLVVDTRSSGATIVPSGVPLGARDLRDARSRADDPGATTCRRACAAATSVSRPSR